MDLVPHPTTPCPAITSLTVDVVRTGELRLSYALRGDLAAIALPPLATPGPADELWRHTCFEAFLGRDGEPAYREYNFAPSGRWAVYAFSAYRQRAHLDAARLAPHTDWRHGGDHLTLVARLPLPGDAGTVLRLGVSAVIELRDGTLSYWALRHPAALPDFHGAESRTLRLEPPPAGC